MASWTEGQANRQSVACFLPRMRAGCERGGGGRERNDTRRESGFDGVLGICGRIVVLPYAFVLLVVSGCAVGMMTWRACGGRVYGGT